MSGPIIRKYGFPNFEKIFGERDLKHGAEPDPVKPDAASTPAASDPKPPQSEAGPGGEQSTQPSKN